MGFIEAYKRLEKICGEILNDERKVSAYIDEMINPSRGEYFVSGWDKDLKQLKHYRWIRNRIAHDPGCTEKNMCTDSDTEWIVNFHSRIMNQTDPLALYRKAIKSQQKQTVKSTGYQDYKEQNCNHDWTTKRLGCFTVASLLFIVGAAIAAVLWLLR